VRRRLERRFFFTGTKSYAEYLRFLGSHPEEYEKLVEHLTIKTSSFFRNPHVFHAMDTLVLPELVAHKEKVGDKSLRFWSAACACGEEPYSIAVLLEQFLGGNRRDYDVTIHATDISREALEKARVSIYSCESVKSMQGSALRKYFFQQGKRYGVRRGIRQMVSFSYFNLASALPPPCLNADCIFCCNVLIYLQRSTQEKVLKKLYDCLAVPGYLVLGDVETLPNSLQPLMECVDKKVKIFRKNERSGYG